MKKALLVLMLMIVSVMAFAGTASAKPFGADVVFGVSPIRHYRLFHH